MLEPGTPAPEFELPAAVDGEITQLSFSEYTGEDVALLSFYPADFSPTCTDEMCSLRDLGLFDLSRDVCVLGISGDSAFSHLAFAERYSLQFPLFSDSAGEVAERYGVLYEDFRGHKRVPKRALFVIDGRQRIRYAWATDDPSQLPNLETIRSAVESVQDEYTAAHRYQDAYANYQYGYSELSLAMEAFEDEQWGLASEAFGEASWYFSAAADGFDSAARFGESAAIVSDADQAAQASEHRRNAARWFGEAALHFGYEKAEIAEESTDDARAQLEAAREYEPVAEPWVELFDEGESGSGSGSGNQSDSDGDGTTDETDDSTPEVEAEEPNT